MGLATVLGSCVSAWEVGKNVGTTAVPAMWCGSSRSVVWHSCSSRHPAMRLALLQSPPSGVVVVVVVVVRFGTPAAPAKTSGTPAGPAKGEVRRSDSSDAKGKEPFEPQG